MVQQGGAGNENPITIPRMTDAQIAGIPSPVDGMGVYGTDDDIFYIYDSVRTKWLSAENMILHWGKNQNADNGYLKFGGDMANGGSGFRMPLDGTITRVAIMSSGGNAAKSYDIEIDESVDSAVTTAANVLTNNTLDIDVDAGQSINIFAQATGTAQKNVSFALWIKWRQ